MEHIAAVLFIVGCSQNLDGCRELPAPTPIFETAQDCASEQPFALEDLAGRAPRVLGTCIAVDPADEEEDGEIDWTVTPDGRLMASFEKPSITVAANTP
jgi:hypothetical protein